MSISRITKICMCYVEDNNTAKHNATLKSYLHFTYCFGKSKLSPFNDAVYYCISQVINEQGWAVLLTSFTVHSMSFGCKTIVS